MNGEISIPRTKHGESRIPNVEKYDLPDAFRLVIQLLDGVAKTRAFLFVGTHSDAERWLDSHRNYRWVKSKTDGILDFVQVTESREERYVPADRADLEATDDLLALPLLRVLTSDNWSQLALSEQAEQFCCRITGADYERDADGILTHLDELVGYAQAALLFDLISHAHAREWPQFHQRLGVSSGQAAIAPPREAVEAMVSADNSEAFVVFDDPDEFGNFFANHSLADWMLFLHPEQRKVVEKDLRGPARLRGISGSGKTSVLVHRARHLAKKHKQAVLLVTLTESMRKLLDLLANDLCGVERSRIHTMTISALAKQVVQDLHPRKSAFYSPLNSDRRGRILEETVRTLRSSGQFFGTSLASLRDDQLHNFLDEEFAYIRSRIRDKDFDQYTDTSTFRRHGRGVPLTELARKAVLCGLRLYTEQLESASVLDHEGIVATAVDLTDKAPGFNQFRCVLCDEVQDLSQLELALLGQLMTPGGVRLAEAEDGLFLAGDGAQTIYKRGFALKRVGIDIAGRSYSLRKNYRNTYEILKAAFGLVAEYEFADVDEDDIARPSTPEFAKRRGERPLIIRCDSPHEEITAIATSVRSLVEMGHLPGQICIVAPTRRLREDIQRALAERSVVSSDLRDDVDYESGQVKVSTIESAKGHEFGAVFILGLVEGLLPMTALVEEIPREAARLYVAMTRAREKLTISYSPSPGHSVSRFLAAIQDDCDEARFREGRVLRVDN